MIIFYYDLDGVLADFDKHYTDITGLPCGVQSDSSIAYADWDVLKAHPTFFLDLPLMEKANLLWNFTEYINGLLGKKIFTRKILSAKTRFFQNCTEQKYEWCLSKLDNCTEDDIIVCERRSDKAKYVDKVKYVDNILVDDRPDNIAEWEAAGGVGFLFDKDVMDIFDKLTDWGNTPEYKTKLKNLIKSTGGL